MAQRTRYTEGQIEQYYDRICMPKARRVKDVLSLVDEEKLEFLTLLQKHHVVKVPWENLTQHYTFHRVVHVKPQHLFNKIVKNAGRGGYCMEVNYMYHTVLLTLGFDVYISGSRIYHPDTEHYGGWTHCVNIVSIAGRRYLLDGGYGGNGPTSPLPLQHALESTQIAPTQMRLLYQSIPQNLNQESKVWIYEYRINESSTWIPAYCFVDLEFLPEDIETMNFNPCLNKQSFFTHMVMAHRFTTSGESDRDEGPGSPNEDALQGEIDGSLILNQDVLKWRKKGQKLVELTFKTEKERTDALLRYFGILTNHEDCENIGGSAAAIGNILPI